MKLTLLALYLAVTALHAESPLPLDTAITNEPVTISCAYVDMSNWPAVFRAASGFRCLIWTSTPDAVAFQVTITTRGAGTAVRTYSVDRTAIQHSFSLAVFPTSDRELMSVTVAEVRASIVFVAP